MKAIAQVQMVQAQESAGNQLLHFLQQLAFPEPLQKMQRLACAATVKESLTVQIEGKHPVVRRKNCRNDLHRQLSPWRFVLQPTGERVCEYKQLPALHERLWSFFAGVTNRKDTEQYRQVLMPKLVADSDGEYRERAKAVLSSRLEDAAATLRWVRKTPPVRFQTMRVQWGSCSPAGRLTLNPQLVKAPRECIDYVLLHELCHLREHNHGRRFHRMLDMHMPRWHEHKAHLDNLAETLLNS